MGTEGPMRRARHAVSLSARVFSSVSPTSLPSIPSPLPAPVLALAAVLAAALAPRAAAAGPFTGKVVVSDTEFGTGYGSDAALASAVRKQSKPAIKGENGNWTLNLMVFLKEAPGAKTINI